MSINTVSQGNPLDQLAQALINRFDANRDGQLTTQEFTSFLSQFLGTLGAPGQSGAAPRANGIVNGGSPPVLEGFDHRNLADPGMTTVKYRFARVAQTYSLDSVRDMPSAQALLNNMKGDLEAAGLTILEIRNDKIRLLDDAGQPCWIDVIRGAGAPNPAFQWLDERLW